MITNYLPEFSILLKVLGTEENLPTGFHHEKKEG